MTGSWLTVKEQMPHRYALALADEGFTAVTFDFSGFGASAGSPQQAELPSRKVGEITAVAEILGTLRSCGRAVSGISACARAPSTGCVPWFAGAGRRVRQRRGLVS